MSLVQKLNGNGKTFSHIAKSSFSAVLQEGQEYQRIDVVFDTYRAISIKEGERESDAVLTVEMNLKTSRTDTAYNSGHY